LNPVSA